MAEYLPFIQSDTNYRLVVPLSGVPYLIDVYWNDRDSAWYMDLYEADETVILTGIKLALGQIIGRRSRHDFFTQHILRVIDTSGSGKDAGFDDLGGRIQVMHIPVSELDVMGTS